MRAHDPARTDCAAAKKAPAVRSQTRNAAPLSAAGVLALQRAAGNEAVARYLQQARAAERHRHGPGCGHRSNSGAAVQRSAVHGVLASSSRPLDTPVREEMEARLGADFSDVRVHTGAAAQRSAGEIGARAYTSGSHIVIGEGSIGRHTLAHELTHVIQQRQGPVAGTDTGDGLRMSDPSDRFERAAEDNARRVLSGPVPVQRETRDAERTLSGAAGGLPVQRTFKMSNKTYAAANAGDLTMAVFDKGRPAQRQWTDDVKASVVAKMREMAVDATDLGRFRTYELLLNRARQLVNAAAAANLPVVPPGTVLTSDPDEMEVDEEIDEEVQISDDEKISRLASFRRRASDVSNAGHLGDFRDTTRAVPGFRYNHVPDSQFYIAFSNSFLTGGPVEHTYVDLLAQARTHTGLTDADLATRFIHALSGPGDAFAGLPADGRKYCAKIVSIIQGSELRRAAGNPTAAMAAFNKVIATPGLSLERALAENAIFAINGGALESQFHRRDVNWTPELRIRALNEYNALARLVTANGFSTATEDDFLAGCQHIAQANVNAFTRAFSHS